jgi:hypothetical protein
VGDEGVDLVRHFWNGNRGRSLKSSKCCWDYLFPGSHRRGWRAGRGTRVVATRWHQPSSRQTLWCLPQDHFAVCRRYVIQTPAGEQCESSGRRNKN